MITEQKLEIFKRYQGDIDGFSRGGKKNEKKLFDEMDWSLIDSVLQDLKLVNGELCSSEYKERLIKLLNDNFDKKAIELINKMV
jgi:hypothetical protein